MGRCTLHRGTCRPGNRAGAPGPTGATLQLRTDRSLPDRGLNHGAVRREVRANRRLILFAPLLLAQTLPRKRFLGPALLAGFHVEAVLLDLLDDVFLLHFALETPQCIFQRFILLDNNFRQFLIHPQSGSDWQLATPLAGRAAAGSTNLWALPLFQLSHVTAASRPHLER